jgi:hypothetical protein
VKRKGSATLERYVFDLSTTEWADSPDYDVIKGDGPLAGRAGRNRYIFDRIWVGSERRGRYVSTWSDGLRRPRGIGGMTAARLQGAPTG